MRFLQLAVVLSACAFYWAQADLIPYPSTPIPAPQKKVVTFATGYIPNVQFTPYYLAAKKGYFAAEGIEVKFNYAMGAEPLKLVAQGTYEFGTADGDALIAAVSQSIPLKGIFLLYQQNPVAVYALKSSGIQSIQDLQKKKIGIPGLYGASYVGWTLASKAEPALAKAELVPIGYTQVQALLLKKVDAALGFENNEPVMLEAASKEGVSVWPLRTYAWLPGNGIVTSQKLLKSDPKLVKGFVRALEKGLRDTLENPDESLAMVKGEFLPDLKGEQEVASRKVLQRTVGLWKAEKLGHHDFKKIDSAVDALLKAKIISKKVSAETVFTNEFLP